jgi:hypothetical protein
MVDSEALCMGEGSRREEGTREYGDEKGEKKVRDLVRMKRKKDGRRGSPGVSGLRSGGLI